MTLTSLTFGFAAGLLIGAANFWALWLVLQWLPRARHPKLWLMTSSALRMVVVLISFYWFMDEHWALLLACLSGFITIRVVITNRATAKLPKRVLPS